MGLEISLKVLDYFVTEKHLVMFKMYIEIHCRVIYFEHNKHCKISNDECIGILFLLHRISKKRYQMGECRTKMIYLVSLKNLCTCAIKFVGNENRKYSI